MRFQKFDRKLATSLSRAPASKLILENGIRYDVGKIVAITLALGILLLGY